MGLLLLDLDDTLIEGALIEADGKLQRKQHELYTEPVLLPAVYDRLKLAAEEGDRFSIVTNQGGVALGFHTQADCYRRISTTIALLSCFWGQPCSVHVAFKMPKGYVPGFKGEDGRKPGPQMLQDAMIAHYEDSTVYADRPVLMIGDRDEDREAAAAAGVDFQLSGDFFAW